MSKEENQRAEHLRQFRGKLLADTASDLRILMNTVVDITLKTAEVPDEREAGAQYRNVVRRGTVAGISYGGDIWLFIGDHGIDLISRNNIAYLTVVDASEAWMSDIT